MSDFIPTIGLEVHVQLKTKSKMFCSCSTDFGAAPNTNICPVCTGQPGVLPAKNKRAIELAVRAGLVLNCRIEKYSVFARKNYFYPDLPKAYQISQYELPITRDGFVKLSGKKIGIIRAHLEEDAGKLLHYIGSVPVDGSLVDLNRCGVPLLEIVSYPDIDSPETAFEYLKTLRRLLRYAEISDCDMEKGSLRCDCNVSVRRSVDEPLGVKTEIKNMNSFREVREAIAYEIERQKKVLSDGGKIYQETRLWNGRKGVTVEMRRKEEAADYRYFPEPDLTPIFIDEKIIEEQRKLIPKLPAERKEKLFEMGLSEYQVDVLVEERKLCDYFIAASENSNPKEVANLIITNLLGEMNKKRLDIEEVKLNPLFVGELADLKASGKISAQVVKRIFPQMFEKNIPPSQLLKNLNIVSDEGKLEKLVWEGISENSSAWEDYKMGKEKASGRIIGWVMKKTRGSSDPATVKKILERLKDEKDFDN
ncbi:MAG: Asp-tRNA(Asn)/Glu-tRNA(Gln) amidotransferase subunit GatB [Elusimicrobia bacterium]|nr:Asp-tRNA(Asn)/Glu-tRNA(Gln) amidotransferase subunit GatB [Elusimicrobiota bacterium]